jgi:hypothetical protein
VDPNWESRSRKIKKDRDKDKDKRNRKQTWLFEELEIYPGTYPEA